MGTPPDRGRALRPARRERPAPWWGTGAGLAAVSTECAAHPVQVHVAAGHEAQGQRRHVVQSATSGGRVPTATGCWEWTHTARQSPGGVAAARLAHWDVVPPPFGIYVHVPFCA